MTDTTANQGATLLSMCAILRYSYSYWYQNYDSWSDTTVATGNFQPLGLGHILKRVGHWCGVAGEDALGFLGAGRVSAGGSVSSGSGVKGSGNYSVDIKKGIKSAQTSSANQRKRYKDKDKND